MDEPAAPPPAPEAPPVKRRAPLIPLGIMAVMLLAGVGIYYFQSLKRPLSDAELEQYLSPTAGERQTLHAANQLSNRIIAGDESRKRFYPAVVALAKHPEPAKRKAVAWVMGEDAAEESFREALVKLVEDPVPIVRHNAALSLARHRSEAARPTLLAMLKPSTVTAPADGVLHPKAKVGEVASMSIPLAMIATGAGEVAVEAPVEGRVLSIDGDGIQVTRGMIVVTVGPAPSSAYAALRALMLPGIGRPEDAEAIQAFLKAVPDAEKQVKDQAQQALEALAERK